jgi:hypothetical protein
VVEDQKALILDQELEELEELADTELHFQEEQN